MKRHYQLILMSLMLLFVGCKEDQSELDFDSLTMSATVTGYIEYDAGVDTLSTNYSSSVIAPAAGQTVFAEVNYSQYTGSSTEKKVFETVTDESGFYTFDIPTTSTGISATIRMQEFTEVYVSLERMEGSTPVYRYDTYTYSYEKSLTSLKPGSYDYSNGENSDDVTCKKTLYVADNVDATSITLTGNVYLAVENGFRDAAYTPASNVEVEFDLSIDDEDYTTTLTTTSAGGYTIVLPITSYADGFEINSISVVGEGSSYTHYTSVDAAMSLSGAYEATDIISTSTTIEKIIEDMNYCLPDVYMSFTPNYNNSLTSTELTPSTWVSNLAGWECYDGFSEYVTISGRYVMPIETSYGVGAYGNPTQQAYIKITYPTSTTAYGRSSKSVYVNTDESGYYSFELPVVDANETYTVAAAAIPSAGLSTITHFASEEQTVSVSGTYALGKSLNVPEAWTELGDQYLAFTAGQDAPSTWNANLAGWQEGTMEFDGTASVSAKIYVASESGYAKGEYVAASDGTVVKFDVAQKDGTDSYTTTYSAVVKDGSIDETVYTKGETDPTISITSVSTASTSSFVHYSSAATTSKLSGSYTYSSSNVIAGDSWNDLGSIYLKFEPTGTAPDDFYSDLAGWVVVADGESSTFTANLYQAVETSYLVGSYVEASDLSVATIKITPSSSGSSTEYSYTVPVTSGKISATLTYPKGTGIADPTVGLSLNSTDAEVDDYTYYTATGSYKIAGSYSLPLSNAYWKGIVQLSRTSFNEFGDIYMAFEPESASITMPSLVGWAKFVNQATTTCSINKTIYKPYETGFAAGAYTKATDTTSAEVYINGYSYDVPVVNGVISVELPYAIGDGTTPTASVSSVSTIYDSAFKHYSADGTSREISVFYNISADPAYTTDSEIYLTLTMVTNTPYDYYENLAGWVRVENSSSKVVTGSIMKAFEKSCFNGSYESAAYEIVTLEYDGKEYVGATDAYGNYSITMAYTTEPTSYSSVTVTPAFVNTAVDYTNYNKTTGEAQSTTSTFSYDFSSNDVYSDYLLSWNSRGTSYYIANEATSQDLLDWVNTKNQVSKGYTKSLTVQFAVKYQVASYTTFPAGVSGGWSSYTTMLPTVVVIDGGDSFTGWTSGSTRQMIIYVSDAVYASSTLSMSIYLYDGYNLVSSTPTPFIHYYEDPSNAGSYLSMSVYGTYRFDPFSLDGKTATIYGSAALVDTSVDYGQMIFSLLDAAPTGWGVYTW